MTRRWKEHVANAVRREYMGTLPFGKEPEEDSEGVQGPSRIHEV